MGKNKLFENYDISALGGTDYRTVLSNMDLWRRSSGHTDDLNTYDNGPGVFYFKLFFYFNNVSDTYTLEQDVDVSKAGNLLGLDYRPDFMKTKTLTDVQQQTLEDFSKPVEVDVFGDGTTFDTVDRLDIEIQEYKENQMNEDVDTIMANSFSNTALNYLLLNGEFERADKLKQFIRLLSNINTYSPWYFTKIGGLDTIINREEFTGDDFTLGDDKSISITCLSDPLDQRIGTLLDLYRDVTHSKIMNKEIIPANLRKFDMGIYIFHTPLTTLHSFDGDYAEFMKKGSNKYITSHKYIELQGCEIDYNSSSAAYSELDNSEGKTFEYTINIKVRKAFEQRWNEFIMRSIGDMVLWDYMYNDEDSKGQTNDPQYSERMENRINKYANTPNQNRKFTGEGKSKLVNMATTFAKQLASSGEKLVTSTLKKLYFGNLFTISPAHLLDSVSNAINNPMGGLSQLNKFLDQQAKHTGADKLPGYDTGQKIIGTALTGSTGWSVTKLPGYHKLIDMQQPKGNL